MDLAKRFFLQEEDGEGGSKDNETYYERYHSDLVAIQEQLDKPDSRVFKGVLKTSARLRQLRAYVSVPGLNLDVAVEGYKNMNRAMDGDTVLVELQPVCQWLELAEANKTQVTDFTNEAPVEARVGVDYPAAVNKDEALSKPKVPASQHSS